MPIKKVKLEDVELNVLDEGEGPPLLFVHGFPLNHTMWNAQIEAFAGTHRVIAPDLRGFGESDVADGTVSMEQYADDLNTLLDALDVDEPVVYCGLSMGGYIGWRFVEKYAPRLAGLVQCDTKAKDDSADVARARHISAENVFQDGPEPLFAGLRKKLFARSTLESRTAVVDAVREMVTSSAPSSIAAALRGMAVRPDSTKLLEEIAVPTLLIGGAEDALTPPDVMRKDAEKINGASFVEIADAGHIAPMEQPEAVNRALREFLG